MNKLARCGWDLFVAPVPGSAIIAGLLFTLAVLLLIGVGAGLVNPPYNISVEDWQK